MTPVPGHFPLFRNHDDHGNPLSRPPTLLVDSEQLESGEALNPEFRAVAAEEIDRFRREVVARAGVKAGKTIRDQDLLREVVNTVGKSGKLGEQVRCVVSVSMLTEGWDASTVTHILGVRAFGTQLLCEQVVGRALRRQSYEINDDTGLTEVEYADVLGVPFDFTAKPVVVKPTPARQTVSVHAVCPERNACEIRFPRVEGYRVELPEEHITVAFTPDSVLELNPELIGPSITMNQGIIGERVDLTVRHLGQDRDSTVAMRLTRHLLLNKYRDAGEAPKYHLFNKLMRVVRQWINNGYLRCTGDTYRAQVLYPQMVDSGTRRNALSKADLDVSAKLPE
jgi:type III restriction enzyme